MSETIERTCDGCEKQLMFTDCSSEYYLELKDVRMPSKRGHGVFGIEFPKKLWGSMHFCGVVCLKKWINEEII